jgi:ankyrin repeat protein
LLGLRTGQGDYGEQSPSSFHIYLWTLGPNLSPLQVAAQRGQQDTLRAMAEFASPVERLLLACHFGRADEARGIVRTHPGIVEGLGPVEQRALTDEAWAANGPAVELLLELGFDPSVPSTSGPTGGTALHCAAWEGSVECVAAILRYPAGRALIDTREATYQGTPLSWCSHGSVNCHSMRADHAAVARLLIAAGARTDREMLSWGSSDAVRAVIEDATRTA